MIHSAGSGIGVCVRGVQTCESLWPVPNVAGQQATCPHWCTERRRHGLRPAASGRHPQDRVGDVGGIDLDQGFHPPGVGRPSGQLRPYDGRQDRRDVDTETREFMVEGFGQPDDTKFVAQ